MSSASRILQSNKKVNFYKINWPAVTNWLNQSNFKGLVLSEEDNHQDELELLCSMNFDLHKTAGPPNVNI
jgi:hypothetical protein